jgi:hypothetical protein
VKLAARSPALPGRLTRPSPHRALRVMRFRGSFVTEGPAEASPA